MNGVIIVNKEKGYTSRDVVNIISKKLKTKKVGHTGTLDPLAEGVLVICIGDATKLVDVLTNLDKEYVAEVVLGVQTDTLDITGEILKVENVLKSDEEIKVALNKYSGTYEQEVPKYSAVKINGKKLYEYARENVDVVLPKRQVKVNMIELIKTQIIDSKTNFKFKTSVSKGTYIRSLIRDVAYELKTTGTMTSLVRTKQGQFDINDSYTLDQINNDEYKLLSIKEVLKDIKQTKIEGETLFKVLNGNIIDNFYKEDKILFLNDDEEVIALYEKDGNSLKVSKMFYRKK